MSATTETMGKASSSAAEIGLFEAMRTCNAMRYLKSDPVPDESLRKALTAATWAPNGGNRQGFRFVVVRDPEIKRRLRDLIVAIFDEYMKHHHNVPRPEMDTTKFDRMMSDVQKQSARWHEIPVIVCACTRLEDIVFMDVGGEWGRGIGADRGRPSVVGGSSIYPAIQNFLVACRAQGLGTVLTTLLCAKEPEVRSLLGIPEGFATAAFIPVGYPLGKGFHPVERVPVETVAFLDHWDRPLFRS